MVGEQRAKMGDFMRELRKYLFQLGVKAERESLTKQSGALKDSAASSEYVGNKIDPADADLQNICAHLMKENDQLKERYEQMLLRYRSEI
jgi:hypothetical protein